MPFRNRKLPTFNHWIHIITAIIINTYSSCWPSSISAETDSSSSLYAINAAQRAESAAQPVGKRVLPHLFHFDCVQLIASRQTGAAGGWHHLQYANAEFKNTRRPHQQRHPNDWQSARVRTHRERHTWVSNHADCRGCSLRDVGKHAHATIVT